MNYIQEINKLAPELPEEVLKDVQNRCSDWMQCGGKETDPYIRRQYEYCLRVLERSF